MMICEYCGRISDAASDEKVICTRCQSIIEDELLSLEPEEKAKKAYERARKICRLLGKIDELREELIKLREEFDAYKKLFNKEF